jgi:hypothetical protein
MCVTAGILRASVIQCALGHSPVLFIILPVTLAGALLLRKNEGGAWASAASMALAFVALTQAMMLGVAAYYLEKTVQTHREELLSWPDDEEVRKYDEISNRRARARKYISEWHRIPLWLKLLLVIGVVAETASAYLFQLFGSRCFRNFDITDSIEEDLGNNVFNLVRSLGWIGIGLFTTGCVVLIILGRWISFKIRGDFRLPEEEEARQRRMSEIGITDEDEADDDDDNTTTDNDKEKNHAIVPAIEKE